MILKKLTQFSELNMSKSDKVLSLEEAQEYHNPKDGTMDRIFGCISERASYHFISFRSNNPWKIERRTLVNGIRNFETEYLEIFW